MSYIEGTARNQSFLLPPTIEEWIPAGHPARVIDWFVESLDCDTLGFGSRNEETGRPSYAPQVLLKVLLYGYAQGERSSRVLERRSYEDLAYLWLTGNLHPDYRTIARFRQEHLAALSGLLKETLVLAAEAGVVFAGTLFADGTKLYASANDNEIASKERMARLEQVAAKLVAEATAVDAHEDTQQGEENRYLVNAERLERIKQKLAACHTALAQTTAKKVSLTDREAKFMKHAGGHGMHLSYNGQLSVDGQGLILEAEVVTPVTEEGSMLAERVTAAESNTGVEVHTVVTDSGYYETNAVRELMEQGKTMVVPHPVTVQHARGRAAHFTSTDFTYQPESDTYQCPQQQELRRKWRKRSKGKDYWIYVAEKASCQSCSVRGQCYQGTEKSHWGRRLAILADREFVIKYEQTMAQQQHLLRRRKSIIEPVFGILKSQLRFRRFLLRGLEKVNGEWRLVAAAYNLRKLSKCLVGNPKKPYPGTAIPVRVFKLDLHNYFNTLFPLWHRFAIPALV
jgi:transposase